jgi:hypothetical protein
VHRSLQSDAEKLHDGLCELLQLLQWGGRLPGESGAAGPGV